MNYLKNLIKSFIFSSQAIEELSKKKFIFNIIFFLVCNLIIISIKLFLIGMPDYSQLTRQIVYNLLFLFFEILFLYIFLNNTNLDKKNTFMRISQAFLITDFFFCLMILLDNNGLQYKLINGFINIYILFYVYRFLLVTIPEINKRKLELFIILSAFLTKLFVTGLFVLYNSISL